MEKMDQVKYEFHIGLDEVADETVVRIEDYLSDPNGLPKSDVLKFFTENGSMVVSLSGIEPRPELYM